MKREPIVNRPSRQAGWTKPIVIFVVLFSAVGVYAGYKYLSTYQRGRRAVAEIRKVASQTYQRRNESRSWLEIEAAIENTLRKKLPEILNLPAEEVIISVRKEETSIRILAEWTLVVNFGLFNVTDKIHFREEHWAKTK